MTKNTVIKYCWSESELRWIYRCETDIVKDVMYCHLYYSFLDEEICMFTNIALSDSLWKQYFDVAEFNYYKYLQILKHTYQQETGGYYDCILKLLDELKRYV